MPQAATMRDLFDRVARRYDLTNRVLSAGSDVRWRRAVVQEVLRDNPQRVLDACSGTADQAMAVAEEKNFHGTVICTDISLEMLLRGAEKIRQNHQDPLAVLSDVHRLALQANVFDCVTVCFGVRNFDSIVEGLKELRRILRPQGKVVILEFTRPAHPWVRRLYHEYLTKALPCIGGILTGQFGAYRYLATSIEGFISPQELTERLESAGFVDVRHRFLTLGIVSITTARKEV